MLMLYIMIIPQEAGFLVSRLCDIDIWTADENLYIYPFA